MSSDSPEMHRLDANLTLPHPLEPALLGTGSGALPPAAVGTSIGLLLPAEARSASRVQHLPLRLLHRRRRRRRAERLAQERSRRAAEHGAR